MKLSTDFAHTISLFNLFQDITDLVQNGFLFCPVLHCVVSNALELFLTELITMSAFTKSSKRLGVMMTSQTFF